MNLIFKQRFSFLLCSITVLLMHLEVSSNAVVQPNVKNLEELSETQINTQNCQNLCGRGDCTGFYCGEGCLCECNKASTAAADATDEILSAERLLEEMQTKARDLNLPFELLVQGPNGNRIISTALQLQQPINSNKDNNMESMERNKRSTVSIYRPTAAASEHLTRQRYANNDNLDWLSDFASGFMRPAPVRGGRKVPSVPAPRIRSPAEQQNFKPMRAEKPKEHTWFESEQDDERHLAKPQPLKTAPYYKQTPNKKDNRLGDSLSFDEQRPSEDNFAQLLYETPMKVVEKLPAAVRDIITRFRMNMTPTTKQPNDMRVKYSDVSLGSSAQEPEDDEPEAVTASYTRNEEMERMFKDMHQKLFDVLGMPPMKTTKNDLPTNSFNNAPSYKSNNYLTRLHDVIQKQYSPGQQF